MRHSINLKNLMETVVKLITGAVKFAFLTSELKLLSFTINLPYGTCFKKQTWESIVIHMCWYGIINRRKEVCLSSKSFEMSHLKFKMEGN